MATAVAGGAMLLSANSANASTKIDDSHVQVVAGDTLSKIAEENNTTVDQLVKDNHIANKDLIHVGDKLVIVPGATDQTAQATVNTVSNNNQASQVQPSQPAQASATTNNSIASASLNGNSMAALRRSIESGGNYGTDTGNGYLGAYQFAPQTIAGIESATGMKWSMDPATQDAFANYYANSRYGGWQNVPTNGGW